MREWDYKESWELKNWCFCTVVLEKTPESLLDSKEIQPVNPKGNQSWIFIGRTDAKSWNSNTLAIWCEEPTHWKRPWWWKRLKAGGEGDDRGWDGWMASPTQWTWVWVNSGSWWWTGRPGVLQSMGSQRVGHNWATELNWSLTQLEDGIKPISDQIWPCISFNRWDFCSGSEDRSLLEGKLQILWLWSLFLIVVWLCLKLLTQFKFKSGCYFYSTCSK